MSAFRRSPNLSFVHRQSGPEDVRHVDPEFIREPVTRSVQEDGSDYVSVIRVTLSLSHYLASSAALKFAVVTAGWLVCVCDRCNLAERQNVDRRVLLLLPRRIVSPSSRQLFPTGQTQLVR